MAATSKIEWCDASWTPVKARVKQDAAAIAESKGYSSLVQIAARTAGKFGCHCEKVSEGCTNCYSATFQSRCLPNNGTGLPFDRRSRDLVDIVLDEAILLQPLRWKRPRKIFVCSQTDWCADFVTDEMRDRMLAVAALCQQHTFLFLTKRAGRCAEYFASEKRCDLVFHATSPHPMSVFEFPPPNVLLGFSAENQECFDARWDEMRPLAAAGWKVWCSVEPLLSAIDISQTWYTAHEKLSWVVVGGESGPYARPMNIAWMRSIIKQCKDAGVPCFSKQLGAHPYDGERALPLTAPFGLKEIENQMRLKDRKGGDIAEWPEDLRVREFPI